MEKENIYSDGYAMSYEHLIRRAHQCERYGVAGANADIYRKFIRNASIYRREKDAIENNKPRIWGKSEEEMLKDYMSSAGEISAFIKVAIDIVKREHSDKLTDEQHNKLDEAERKLSDLNIENITEAIKIAEGAMLEIELFPQ